MIKKERTVIKNPTFFYHCLKYFTFVPLVFCLKYSDFPVKGKLTSTKSVCDAAVAKPALCSSTKIVPFLNSDCSGPMSSYHLVSNYD
jgi:hypothetical protein